MRTQKDPRANVLLVGYERQENLGLRSIIAYLEAHGHHVALVPFCPGCDEAVLSAVQKHEPRLIGFSLIFQYSLSEFEKLARYLRENGVTAHFTAGGHFPSLRPREALDLIPELDSVVRFEGEATLLDLVEHLDQPELWTQIRGLAFRNGAKTAISELRPLIADLDSLPLPYRDEPHTIGGGIKMAAMLSSRGCLFDCSFCSIRQFYGASQGSLRRVRSPQAVVREMLDLYSEKNIRFFNFWDDDFGARSAGQRKWLKEFLQELNKAGLVGNVAWKISCRADDLDPETLTGMLDHGLVAVYLGVESGNDTGLTVLNKRVSAAQNLAAIELLKQYNVATAIGFMLFDPASTVETVRENIRFLRKVGEDGHFSINFCKMLPYAGTPIETRLRQEGRLNGTTAQPDYDFDDPTLNWYEFLVQKAFYQRNFSPNGLVALLQQADFDWRVTSYFTPRKPDHAFEAGLKELTRETNMLATETLEALLDDVLTYGIQHLLEDQERLVRLFEREWRGEMLAELRLKALSVSAEASSEVTA